MSEITDLLILLLPLYASGIHNSVKLSQMRGTQKHCLFCQKSDKIKEQELEKL